jgi:hypothetical protein
MWISTGDTAHKRILVHLYGYQEFEKLEDVPYDPR